LALDRGGEWAQGVAVVRGGRRRAVGVMRDRG